MWITSDLSQNSPRRENKEGQKSRNAPAILPSSIHFLIFLLPKATAHTGVTGHPRFSQFIKLTINIRDAKSCSLIKKKRGLISTWKTKGSPGLLAVGAYEVLVHPCSEETQSNPRHRCHSPRSSFVNDLYGNPLLCNSPIESHSGTGSYLSSVPH